MQYNSLTVVFDLNPEAQASWCGLRLSALHRVLLIHTVRTTEERTLTEDFRAQYQRHQSPVLRTIERKACGCDYGGTSWTTRDEADRICGLLDLRPGQRLLEVGAGSGWPGLYLAGQMDCDVAFVDLPFEGLQHRRASCRRRWAR